MKSENYKGGEVMDNYIADDRNMHEMWEEIQQMTDEEREQAIRDHEKKKCKEHVGE